MTTKRSAKAAPSEKASAPKGARRIVDLDAKVQALMEKYPKTMARLAE